MTIVVNGRSLSVDQTSLTYAEIVALARSGRSKSALHTVVYVARGQGDTERSGSVTPGQSVELAEGMIISAMVTDNA